MCKQSLTHVCLPIVIQDSVLESLKMKWYSWFVGQVLLDGLLGVK